MYSVLCVDLCIKICLLIVSELKLNNEDHNKLSKFERRAMEEYMHSLVSLENDKIDRKMQRTSER